MPSSARKAPIEVAGQTRWIRGAAEAHFDAEQRPLRAVGVLEDITERKVAEIALEESLRFAQASLDALAANIAVLDGDSYAAVWDAAKAEERAARSERPTAGQEIAK